MGRRGAEAGSRRPHALPDVPLALRTRPPDQQGSETVRSFGQGDLNEAGAAVFAVRERNVLKFRHGANNSV